jgi:HEAT repeat protein/ATP/ADP translocase
MSLIKRLPVVIEPAEQSLVLLLLLLSFAMGTALVFVDVASRALFLTRFPASQLPYAYLGSAAVIPVIGLIFGWLQRHLTFGRLAMGMVAFLLLSLLALWGGIALVGAAWPVFALMIWYRLYYAFNSLLFWGLASQLFTLRQGKRLFGLVGTGEPVAGVIGYFSTSLIARWLGTESMLLIAGAGLILGIAALIGIDRLGRARQAEEDVAAPAQATQIRRSGPGRYTVLLVVVAVAAILCYLFADYGFSAESERAFTSAEQLAGFFGIFFGAVAICRIVFRSVVAGWLLRRFGLRVGLLALPLAFILSTGAVLLVGGLLGNAGSVFALMAATRFLGSLLQPSIQRATMQVLYQPLATRQRLAIQSMIEGVIEPVALGAASLLLIGLSVAHVLSTLLVAAVILAIGVIWSGVAFRLMADYRDTLGRALARRLLEGSALVLTDASSRKVLDRTLRSDHPGEVIYALGLLERADPQLLAGHLPALLDHPDPLVRREAATRIGRTGDPGLLDRLAAACASEGSPDVRARMVQVLGAVDGHRASELIRRAHADPAPQVRDAALLSNLRASDALTGDDAVELHAMLASTDPSERSRAAKIIGRLGTRAWANELIRLMDDPDPHVRRETLRAAGHHTDQATLDALLDALGRPATRGPASAALTRRGESVIPAIASALGRAAHAPALMASLIRVCGRVRGDAAVELLKAYLAHPDSEVRYAAILSLRRCGFRASGPTEQLVRAQIRVESAHMLRIQEALGPLVSNEGADLLRDALKDRISRLRQATFALLELVCDPRSIRRIEQHIDSPAVNKRDYAHELLELHVDAELRQIIQPIISPASAPSAQAEGDLVGWLRRLIGSGEPWVTPWITICALAFVRQSGIDGLAEEIAAARSSSSALVCETAAWAAGETADAGLTTVEKVQILKTVNIFGATQGDILAEVADLLSPVELPDGGLIFSQGDVGDSMYIIVRGEVLIHDGEHRVAQVIQHEVFGEMALLDSETRSASASALGPTLLLRLAQEPFYELMDDRIEVAHGVIRVINRRLRASVRDLAEARAMQG